MKDSENHPGMCSSMNSITVPLRSLPFNWYTSEAGIHRIKILNHFAQHYTQYHRKKVTYRFQLLLFERLHFQVLIFIHRLKI